jgi:hypothetical protein
MRAVFVNLKSELSIAKQVLEAVNFKVYRTRTECNCTAPQNRRNAIIAIQDDNESHQLSGEELTADEKHRKDQLMRWFPKYSSEKHLKVIRCRGCVKKGPAHE